MTNLKSDEQTERDSSCSECNTRSHSALGTLNQMEDLLSVNHQSVEVTESDYESDVTIPIQPAKVAKYLLGVTLIMATAGTIANIVIYHVAPHPEHRIARLAYRFDLGMEPSIPAWYSSSALLASSLLLLTIASVKGQRAEKYVKHWYGLSAVFLCLAIDEAVMFHEIFVNVLRAALNTHGIFYFAWVIPGSIFVLTFAACYFKFLLHQSARTRWLFITAGAVFVGGAIGMEMIAGIVVEGHGVEHIGHTIVQTIEESCEMIGVVIFLYALLDVMQREFGQVRFSLSSPPEAPPT